MNAAYIDSSIRLNFTHTHTHTHTHTVTTLHLIGPQIFGRSVPEQDKHMQM